MKKVIRASRAIKASAYDWTNEKKTNSGKYAWRAEATMRDTGNRYRVYWGTPKDGIGVNTGFEIDRIAPYDDAAYVWAKMGNDYVVKFCKSGKVIDKMTVAPYEDFPEDWEDKREWMQDTIERTLEELELYNKDIEPKIIHN